MKGEAREVRINRYSHLVMIVFKFSNLVVCLLEALSIIHGFLTIFPQTMDLGKQIGTFLWSFRSNDLKCP